MITRVRLKEILDRFSRCELAVLGDVMLDEYLWGKVERISPEAPVPVVHIRKETWRPGGASNVASNIVALGARAYILGVVGPDKTGERLRESQTQEKIDTTGLIVDPDRQTTVKTRVIGQNQQMLRIDREHTTALSTKTVEALGEIIKRISPKVDGIIVSDYAKGVIVKDLLSRVIKEFRRQGKFVNIDPKLKNFPLYEGATIITPNSREAESALGRVFETEEDILRAGTDLLKHLSTDAVMITRGEHGMSLFERNAPPLTIPTQALEVFDVTGAGDTVIATFSLALAAGCKMAEAVEVANLAAGVVVGIVGTATTTKEKILDHFDRIHYRSSE